jgi:hypothetical protein
MISGCGAAICLAAQPSTVFGSPDVMVVRGVSETLAVTAALAEAIVAAVRGKTTASAITSAINGSAKRFGTGKIEKPIGRELMHGALLGALDAWHESETDRFVPVESFAAPRRGYLLAGFGGDTRFSARPLADAIKAFLEKKAVTREVFDEMEKAAQRRAFTVAKAANEAMVRVVKQELVRQLAAGADLADFGKHAAARFESAGWTPANPSHVETVFRTNVIGAYSSGRVRQMTQPEVLDLRPFWQSMPIGDGPPRQRKTHREFVLRATDPFWQTAAPPYGYNCFVPGTAVEGRFIGASRAIYTGQTVELTTAEGRRLTVTANHPVLTPQGFVPAKALAEGDELVCYRAEPGIGNLRAGAERHEDHAPATVEQVFGALAKTGLAHSTATGAEDFHGEARRFNGDIEVVGTYRILDDRLRSEAGAQHRGHLALEAPDTLPASAARDRRPGERVLRHDLPAPSAPGPGELALGSARRLDGPPLHELRIGPAARLDTVLAEDPIDDLPADVKLARELLARGAGAIALDHIVRIRKLDGVHTVYDLETGPGWLVAEGIVTSNCRCRLRSLSLKQGAGRVQEGTSIHGLPDHGFASGMGALFEGGTVPTTKPANDPPPERERAND